MSKLRNRTAAKRGKNRQRNPGFQQTHLHAFLKPRYEEIPGLVVDGRIATEVIAQQRGVSRHGVYRWFSGFLTMRGARDLVAVTVTDATPDGTVTLEELVDYIS